MPDIPLKGNDLIRGLWPLPGGNKRYLDTLNRIVKWVASTPGVTEDTLIEWLISQYNVSKGSATGYVRVVCTLGALEVSLQRVVVTTFGQQLLELEGEAKARFVIDRFMKDYLGFREVLTVYDRADGAIHLDEMVERLQPYFPRWTSGAQYEYRALWLLSLGALEQERGRYYAITELGKDVAAQYAPVRDIDAAPPQPDVEIKADKSEPVARPKEKADVVSHLAQELREAATDGQNPERLEQIVAEAFLFLGLSVDHLGASGETDVVARAKIGDESYAVVVDAKARGGGKVQDLNVFTLLDHRKENQADYAMVIAGDFAAGRVANHASANGVVLLPIPVLISWLQLHARTPLNLHQHRVMFKKAGLLSEIPNALELAAEEQAKWGELLVDLLELILEAYYEQGLLEPLPRDMLFYTLVSRLSGVRYNKKDVQQAVDFLVHPVVSAMLSDEKGVSLAMDRATLARSLRALADRIEMIESETQV